MSARLLQTFTAEGFTAHLFEMPDGRCVIDRADADIDTDGSPHAYAPGNRGTDDLRNALDSRGRYVGILTDTEGQPLLQGPSDPAPGFYISTTAYQFFDQRWDSQCRYLNGEVVPFIVVPPIAITAVKGIVLGCHTRVTFAGMVADGIVGDVGPRTRVGEISPAMARLLGINPDPRRGGEDRPLLRYEWWPGVLWKAAFPLLPSR